jgi:hypothetical protein
MRRGPTCERRAALPLWLFRPGRAHQRPHKGRRPIPPMGASKGTKAWGAAHRDMVSHGSGHGRPDQGSGADVLVNQGYKYTKRKAEKHQGITMDTYRVLVEAEEDRAEPAMCAQRSRRRSRNGTTASCRRRQGFWTNRDEQQHEGTKAGS